MRICVVFEWVVMKMVLARIIVFCAAIQLVKCLNNNLNLITKLPRIPLVKYHSYSSVMIIHFDIPPDTSSAVFKFKARDDSTSVLVRNCDPRNVTVFLKTGSYPVVNPDGVPLPKSFLNISRPDLYELTLKTDVKPYYLNISAPVAGNWFAIAFVSWTDPNKDRIQQQGLTSECEANLYTELYVDQNKNIILLSPDSQIKTVLHENKALFYKFFVPEDFDHVLIALDVQTPCKLCDRITILAQSAALPTREIYLDKLDINAKYEGLNLLQIRPLENRWQYIKIEMSNSSFLKVKSFKDYAEFELQIKYFTGLNSGNVTSNLFKTSISKQILIKNQTFNYYLPYKQYNLMRLTAPDNFIFEYDFPPDNGSTPILLNVTAFEMTVLRFSVYDILDIGGTLTLGLAIKPDLTSKTAQNFTVVACIRKDLREIPTQSFCFDGNQTKKAPFVLNSTAAGTLEFVHVPFPDPGTYFLTLRAFFNNCSPCNCSEICREMIDVCVKACEYNCTGHACERCGETCRNDVTSAQECEGCDCEGDCERFEEDEERNTSIVFSISSHPCIAGRCGRHGKCNHYMAGGFIFSACQCVGGFRGWDCSDGSQALSDNDVLVAILLLTLSNLLFIPSVYFAYKRSYYTEACTYAASMISSTFYHACDSKENQYGFCLFPIGVLQFLDFYCALLGIWVTLVAMAYTNNRVISICHVLGAIVLAFGVTYNKHALWVYLLPTLSGIVIIAVNWGLQCRKTKKLFPAKKYLKLYMPLGAFLVLMGLISFAFLETKENYKVVHSLWHMVMAVSLIFLLPNQAFAPKS